MKLDEQERYNSLKFQPLIAPRSNILELQSLVSQTRRAGRALLRDPTVLNFSRLFLKLVERSSSLELQLLISQTRRAGGALHHDPAVLNFSRFFLKLDGSIATAAASTPQAATSSSDGSMSSNEGRVLERRWRRRATMEAETMKNDWRNGGGRGPLSPS